jgi:hypothetical protein
MGAPSLRRNLPQGWETTIADLALVRKNTMAKPSKSRLSHFAASGQATMVDVGA